LTELLLTLAIAAILATLAAPSFREFIADQRVRSASFDVMSMLTMARSEAIKRNSSVILSGIGSGTLQITAGGVVIQQREALLNLTLTCKSGGTQVTCADVIYSGNGRLQAVSPAIEISSPASTQMSCIRVDLSGRPTSKQGAC
jgi:type IV fimbrial biogenesis protein FimT